MKSFKLTAMAMVVAIGVALVGCERSSDSDSSSSSGGLTISPASITISISAVTNVAFSVTGGTAPFAWSVNDNALGTLVASGANAIYTSKTNAGMNFVTVTDGNTNSVAATVTQN